MTTKPKAPKTPKPKPVLAWGLVNEDGKLWIDTFPSIKMAKGYSWKTDKVIRVRISAV